MTTAARLTRSSTDKFLCGVASGVAEYLDVDPTLVRLAWVVLCFATLGLALLLYVTLCIIMPRDETRAVDPQPAESYGSVLPSDEADRSTGAVRRRRNLLGLVLVCVGAAVLLANLGVFWWIQWDLVWPLVLIGTGIAIIFVRSKSS